MRLTQRQLKRIIREEYSRLQRAGLLREWGPIPPEEMEDFEDESGAAPYSRKKGKRTKGGDRFSEALALLQDHILAAADGTYSDHFDGTGNYHSCISTWDEYMSLALWSWCDDNGYKDLCKDWSQYKKLWKAAESFIEAETEYEPWVKDYNWD